MNFLNALLLGGVAAAAVPIIIHLLSRRRVRVVRWGAMHLLENVLRTNQRRFRLEQWLLLLVRATLPALLALLMARPVWHGARALLGEGQTATVILLDNSYSMSATREGVSSWSRAREQAAQILGALKRGSEAQVLLMGQGGGALLDAPTREPAQLVRALPALLADHGPAELPAALDAATKVFGGMHESARRLVVLTDFQRTSFGGVEDDLAASLVRLRHSPSPPQIVLCDAGRDVRENVAVESLDLSPALAGVGQTVSIRARLHNFGDADHPALRVSLRVDGQEGGATQLHLGSRQTAQATFTHRFEGAGSHVLEVRTEADALPADDQFMASLSVRERVPVLLVDGDPSTEPLKGETDFVEIALQPAGTSPGLFAAKSIPVAGLEAPALAEAALVVLANVPRLDDAQLQLIEDHVRRGGGLLVAPGSHVDAPWYNARLHRGGAGLLPLALGEVLAPKLPGSVLNQRFEHPALALFNDPRNGSLSEASIRSWYRLLETPAVPARVLARLQTNDPFLAEKTFGAGRVLQLATALDADWSNFPLRSTYLPFVQRLATYLAAAREPSRNLETGQPLLAHLPGAKGTATLARPDGAIVRLPIIDEVVQYAATQSPGVYTLTPPDAAPQHFAVNAARRESDLARLSSREMDEFAARHQMQVVRSAGQYHQAESEHRYGRELWPPLLWLLLALCLAELLLQQRMARARLPA